MTIEPKIRIENQDEIKILVCHLIYALGCPLSREQLIEITSYEDAVNYFDIMSALEAITDKLCTVEELNGVPVYSNTDAGISAAKELSDMVPLSVREKMFTEAVRIYTRDAEKNESPVTVRYAIKPDGICTVGITVIDKKCGKQMFYCNFNTDSQQKAESIKKKINESPLDFVSYIEKYFK